MNETAFRTKRRQKFLTVKFYKLNKGDLAETADLMLGTIKRKRAKKIFDSSTHDGLFKWKLKLLRLSYTAGEPIESLTPLFADAMKWFGEWHVAYRAQVQALSRDSGEELRTDGTPVYFEDLFHYQLAIDVLSLGILLGEGEAVRQAAFWMTRYRGEDMLFETLIEKVVADPNTDVTEFFHEMPYGLLLDAIFTAETPDEASACVRRYLEGWYKAFEGVPWHDGHLASTAEYSNYEGYWAFEAAAVCVLHGIDDSSFRDHIVYPKDMADSARGHDVLNRIRPGADARPVPLRCEAGQPCPQTGYWSTPAKADSRAAFKVGEVLPEVPDSPWGATIWCWDEKQ